MGSRFSGSHRRARTPSYIFTGFHRWGSCITTIFHPKGYLSLLAIIHHTFFHVMQPRDSIRSRPMVPILPSNTKHSVDPYDALTPMSCDVPVYKCNVRRHCMPIPCHMYNECYMDNQAHAFHHPSWIIISICI